MKKTLMASWLVCLLMIQPVAGSSLLFEKQANQLEALGLFKGTPDGFELARPLNRVEGAVLMLRLLGKENQAQTLKASHPFTDVPGWANEEIGYLYQKGLVKGVSKTRYDSSKNMTKEAFMTLMLRVLGYQDPDDFTWSDSILKATDLKVIDLGLKDYLISQKVLLRDHVCAIMLETLQGQMKQGGLLYDKLMAEGVVDLDTLLKTGVYLQDYQQTVSGRLVSTSQIAWPLILAQDGVDHFIWGDYPYGLSPYPTRFQLEVGDLSYLVITDKKTHISVGDEVTMTLHYIKEALPMEDNSTYWYWAK